MKKHDLLALLATIPDDAEILTYAYEDGYTEPGMQAVTVRRVEPGDWHGEYQDTDEDDPRGFPAWVM